jgi:3-oxoacyl-[acyl-carrier protein] reductase
MDLGIRNRVAIVGGASKGLGKASATRLAEAGARLVLCARGDVDLEKTTLQLREHYNVDILPVPGNLVDAKDIQRVYDAALQFFGKVDILVNNIGGPPAGRFLDFDDDAWQGAFERLVLYPVRIIRLALPGMIERKWGRIVNITSMSVKEPVDNLILSNVFRAGWTALSKTLSRDLAADNVLINSVCPGAFRTDRQVELLAGRAAKEGRTPEQIEAEMVKAIPAGRLLEPDELGSLVAFLCSERASGMTGTSVPVDGGYLRGLF